MQAEKLKAYTESIGISVAMCKDRFGVDVFYEKTICFQSVLTWDKHVLIVCLRAHVHVVQR